MAAQIIQMAGSRKPRASVPAPSHQLSERDSRRLEGLWNSISILETTAAACRAEVAKLTQQSSQMRG